MHLSVTFDDKLSRYLLIETFSLRKSFGPNAMLKCLMQFIYSKCKNF